MKIMETDKLLPYFIIAKMTGLEKCKPEDPKDMMWTKAGAKYVLTPIGFQPSYQYNYRMLYDRTQHELEAVSEELLLLKKKHKNLLEQAQGDEKNTIGKRTKKNILSILNAPKLSDTDKLAEIDRYLRASVNEKIDSQNY